MFRFVSSVLPERAVQGLTGIYFKAQHLLTVGSGKFHSSQATINYPKMNIQIHPALADNYMYLIIDEKSGEAAVVDPVTPETVLEAVKEAQVNLTTVITTHHHWDHAGGNEALVKLAGRELRVYGGDDRIGALTDKVKHGDTLTLGSLTIKCFATPCHTTGHICYLVTPESDNTEQKPAVFTGDTLFLGGCGKFFEGTAEEMYTALITTLSALPDDTDVYCGHEYATSNLKFGLHVEPENPDTKAKYDWVVKRRKESLPSVPSTIGGEKKHNPFMRVEVDSVQARCGTTTGVETMRHLRSEKDNWKPPA